MNSRIQFKKPFYYLKKLKMDDFKILGLVVLIAGAGYGIYYYCRNSRRDRALLEDFQRHAYYVQIVNEIRFISDKIPSNLLDVEWEKNVSDQILLGGGDANSEEIKYFYDNRENLERKVMNRIKENLNKLKRERQERQKAEE